MVRPMPLHLVQAFNWVPAGRRDKSRSQHQHELTFFAVSLCPYFFHCVLNVDERTFIPSYLFGKCNGLRFMMLGSLSIKMGFSI